MGVLILGLVVAPLLHTMVTAMRTAAMGRTAHDLNLAAQSILETVAAEDMDELLEDHAGVLEDLASYTAFYERTESGGFAETETPKSDDCWLGLTDLLAAGSGQGYHALVHLDAESHAAAGHANDEAVSVYTVMDSIFTQPDGAGDNPDVQAASYFADLLFDATLDEGYAGGDFPDVPDAADFFFGSGVTMDRTVTIQLDEREDELDNINGDILYTYSASCDLVFTGEEGSSTEHFDLGSYSYYEPLDISIGDEQSNEAPKAFYFFFCPNYGGSDLLDIVRGDAMPLRMFLVRQSSQIYFGMTTPAWDQALGAVSARYLPTVRLREPFDLHTALKPAAEIYLDFDTADNNASTRRFRFATIHDGISMYRGVFDAQPGLVVQEKQDRLYNVTVTLYEAGTPLFSERDRVFSTETTVVK